MSIMMKRFYASAATKVKTAKVPAFLKLKEKQKEMEKVRAHEEVARLKLTDLYPPVKPKFPPGDWGNMEPKTAWLCHREAERVSALPTLIERLEDWGDWRKEWGPALDPRKFDPTDTRMYLAEEHYPMRRQGNAAYMYRLLPFTVKYGTLPFTQYVTKTHVIDVRPDTLKSAAIDDEDFELCRTLLKDAMSLVYGQKFRRFPVEMKEEQIAADLTHEFLHQIIKTVIAVFAPKFPHLLDLQFDENVRVEAFWRRTGYDSGEKRPEEEKPGEEKATSAMKGVSKIADDVKFISEHYSDFQLRSRTPLAAVMPMSDPLVSDGDYPIVTYNPKLFGSGSTFHRPVFCPGFWPGDPCEFGVCSFHVTNLLTRKFGVDHLPALTKNAALTMLHNWTLAQAYYQGFSLHHELTYPFTSQAVLSDGPNFTFAWFQLNTLQHWKDDLGNKRRNLFWCSEPVSLGGEFTDGQMKDFNDETLRQIIQFVVRKPDNFDEIEHELRPFLQEDPFKPADHRTFIELKQDEEPELPTPESEIYGA